MLGFTVAPDQRRDKKKPRHAGLRYDSVVALLRRRLGRGWRLGRGENCATCWHSNYYSPRRGRLRGRRFGLA